MICKIVWPSLVLMIVALDVLFVGGFDEEASPLGAKVFGKLTAVSVAPAIANAVDHATGERVRDLPIAVGKVLRTMAASPTQCSNAAFIEHGARL